MLRRPPKSTLFPYTNALPICRKSCGASIAATTTGARSSSPRSSWPRRSEEHTSELQSRGHLVCRLLLEKKKNHKNTSNTEAINLTFYCAATMSQAQNGDDALL